MTDAKKPVTNIVKTAPKRIYLVIGDDVEPDEDFGKLEIHSDTITWCQDKINSNDIVYVRADVAQDDEALQVTSLMLAQAQARVKVLESALRAAEYATWIASEHAALHFGTTHNVAMECHDANLIARHALAGKEKDAS